MVEYALREEGNPQCRSGSEENFTDRLRYDDPGITFRDNEARLIVICDLHIERIHEKGLAVIAHHVAKLIFAVSCRTRIKIKLPGFSCHDGAFHGHLVSPVACNRCGSLSCRNGNTLTRFPAHLRIEGLIILAGDTENSIFVSGIKVPGLIPFNLQGYPCQELTDCLSFFRGTSRGSCHHDLVGIVFTQIKRPLIPDRKRLCHQFEVVADCSQHSNLNRSAGQGQILRTVDSGGKDVIRRCRPRHHKARGGSHLGCPSICLRFPLYLPHEFPHHVRQGQGIELILRSGNRMIQPCIVDTLPLFIPFRPHCYI